NSYPTWMLTRSKTRQPGFSLCGRDPNRCFCAGWRRESLIAQSPAGMKLSSHLATVFQVPRWTLEGCVKRRDMLRLTGAAAAIAAVGSGRVLPPDTEDMFSSIAAGDPGH